MFFQFYKEDPGYLRRFYLLSRIIKPFFSILQRRPRILKFQVYLLLHPKYFLRLILRTAIMKMVNNIKLLCTMTTCISMTFFYFTTYWEFFFMLGRILKIFIFSILQRRHSIFKKIFCLVE